MSSKLGWVDKRGNAVYLEWKPPITHKNKACVRVEKLRGMFQRKTAFSIWGGNFHPSSFGYSFQHFKLIGLVKFDTR